MTFDKWYEKKCIQDSPGKGMYPTQNGDWIYKEDCKEIWDSICAALSASTEAAAGEPPTINRSAPFPNCKFRECDLPGQCRGEGRCHHPASGDRDAPSASGQNLTDEFATLINRMRKDETRGDTVFRCGFNGALDAVLKLVESRASSATASDKEA